LTLHGSASPDPNPWDVLRLCPEGVPDEEFIICGYIGGQGQTEGFTEITLPTCVLDDPRRLEVRVLSRDHELRTRATSNAVTPEHSCEVSVGPDDPEEQGRLVTFRWHAPLLHSIDGVGLYQVGAPNEQLLTYAPILGAANRRSGSFTFWLPDPSWRPGPYEVRFFLGGTMRLLAVSAPFVGPE